jgi:hypothetical protein
VSFRQLYYTSCEHGLGNYAGFQFNAATDGTPAETLQAVEALTTYQAPRSRVRASTAQELDQCPVNLCFTPGEADRDAILANVRYAGRDYSNRTGNYFAHALATADLDKDDPALLPIAAWRAPWWVCRQSPTTSLPGLAGPLEAGPLSRDSVAAFLDEHPHRDLAPTLLTAAGLARSRGSRQVLVVAESTDEIASWFAVISYMLPPRLVRRLSFSTYLSRPTTSRLHLLGTVPEGTLDLGPAAPETFYLFDFPGKRFPQLTPHPLAHLCCSVGLRALPALWGWADRLASGRGATFDDWHPVVAAATALGRMQLGAADLDLAAGWLANQDDLPKSEQNAVADALNKQTAITTAARESLGDVSARTGNDDLWARIQYRLLEPSLLRRADSTGVNTLLAVPPGPAAGVARVRDQLTQAAEGQLRLATDRADTLSLLCWCAQAQLLISPDLLRDRGQALIAPLLAADMPSLGRHLPQPQRDQAAQAAGQFRELRAGVVGYLATLASREPAAMAAAMLGAAGELLRPGDVPRDSPIYVYDLAARQLRKHGRPAQVLADLAKHRDIRDTDDDLLAMLWPGGRWSIADASEVLATVDADVLGGALGWFEATVAALPHSEDHQAWARLCAQLAKSPLADRFTGKAMPALGEVRKLWEACKAAEQPGDLTRRISADPVVAILTTEWIAPRLAALCPQSPKNIVTALAKLPAPAVHRYLDVIERQVTRADGTAQVHAAALWLARPQDWARPHATRLDQILRYVARRWRPPQVEATATLLDTVRKRDGKAFRDWTTWIRHGRRAPAVAAWRGLRRLARQAILTRKSTPDAHRSDTAAGPDDGPADAVPTSES